QDIVKAHYVAGRDDTPRLGDEIEDLRAVVIKVRRVHEKQPSAFALVGDAGDHLWRQGFLNLPFQSRHLGEGDVGGQEVKRPALLHPVRLRVAIEVFDSIDRFVVAEESERRNQRAGTDAGNNMEPWSRKRMGLRYFAPALEDAGSERAPVAAA